MGGIGGEGVICIDGNGSSAVRGVVAGVSGIGSCGGRARFGAIEELTEGDASPVAEDQVRDEQ